MRKLAFFRPTRPSFANFVRIALSLCVLAIAWSFSDDVRAQTTTTITITPLITRVPGPGGSLPTRPTGLPTNNITRAECEADVRLRFSATMTNIGTGVLQAWAGSGDCNTLAARAISTATCFPVVQGSMTPRNSFTFDVRVQDLALKQLQNPKEQGYKAATAADKACDIQTSPNAVTMQLYLLYLKSEGGDPAINTTGRDLSLDMRGPDGPSDVSASEGDRVILVNWTPPPSSGSDRSGFRVYYKEVPAAGTPGEPVDSGPPQTEVVCQDGGVTDGGVDDAGNPLDGGATDGGCTEQEVDGGTGTDDCPPPTSSDPYVTAGGLAAQQASIKGLQNDVRYSVAVAALDKAGNIGKLSSAACAVPGPVADFFNNYRLAGGLAGGCALEGGTLTGGALVGGLSTFALVFLRRRRKGKPS